MCLQFLLCLLCTCVFMGLLSHKNIKHNLICLRKQNMISGMKEKIFNAQGDTYLSDTLSYASPSCHIACRWLALNEAWLCLEQNNFLLTQQVTLHLHVIQHADQGLQILLMSGVIATSASQILESFWNIWSQVPQWKKPFSDFPARGPGMYTLSWGIHEVAVAVRWPGKLKSMMAVIK